MNEQKQLSEVIGLWKTDKKQYVKRSSFSAYTLLIENHLLPVFGDKCAIEEGDVQSFVFQKLETGLSHKTIKDILIVLKMILKFGAKNKWMDYTPFDIQFPTEREKHNIEVLTKTDQKKNNELYSGTFYISESRSLYLSKCRYAYRGSMCINLGRY